MFVEMKFSSSGRVGRDVCAPNFWHAKAPAALATVTAATKSNGSDCLASSTVKQAVKASPAAVVSTGVIENAGT